MNSSCSIEIRLLCIDPIIDTSPDLTIDRVSAPIHLAGLSIPPFCTACDWAPCNCQWRWRAQAEELSKPWLGRKTGVGGHVAMFVGMVLVLYAIHLQMRSIELWQDVLLTS